MKDDWAFQKGEAGASGLACVALVAWILGDKRGLADLQRSLPPFSVDLSSAEMIDIMNSRGMSVRMVKCGAVELSGLPAPAILSLKSRDYVVLDRTSPSRGARIYYPGKGWRWVRLDDFRAHYSGVAFETALTPGFERRRPAPPIAIMSLLRMPVQMRTSLLQAVLLTMFLATYTLALPFYTRLAVDEAVQKADGDFLIALAIGFGLFAVFNAGALILRGMVLQTLGALITWDVTKRVYRHLIRLPLEWFQRRRLPDVLSRFQSLDPVRMLIANGLATLIIDGFTATVVLLVMLVIAPVLAVVCLCSVALYFALRLALMQTGLRLASSQLEASIAEQGKRIETLRAIQTIKALNIEIEQEADWSNKFAEVVRTSRTNGWSNGVLTGLQSLFLNLNNVIVVYLGAHAAIEGQMSLGLLFAFVLYQAQFTARTASCIEQIVAWRMLDLHSHRLAEVLISPPEEGLDKPAMMGRSVKGGVKLENVSFAYGPRDPFILRGVNFEVEPGEFVAIVGASGCGKSTLLKLIAGLYRPVAGQVLLDGTPYAQWGPRAVRRRFGIVLQDDTLLSGTIAANVALFDEVVDVDRVWECLQLAQIYNEVKAMPFGVDTRIGDLGTTLSGGQIQRICLARALYRKPSVILLDEATSHLDLRTDKIVGDTLGALRVTRIVVSHRTETIAAANRVIALQNGTVIHQASTSNMAEGKL